MRMIVVASLRVYGGKLICGTAAACRKRGRGVELSINMTERHGILNHQSVTPENPTAKLTTSPSLATADNSVCGASRCLSIPSKTSTNFSLPFPVAVLKHSASSTARVLTCSHLPFPNFSHSSCRPRASSVAQSTFVNRCRPVIHSVLRTMACGDWRVERTARTMVDLQVSDTPWTTNVDGLGIPD